MYSGQTARGRNWRALDRDLFQSAARHVRVRRPLPGSGRRDLVDHAHLLEPALRVDRGLAAVRGRGHGLAVAVVVNVAGDEDTLDRRSGLVADAQVALLVDLEPV